jgi:hypothetical protein
MFNINKYLVYKAGNSQSRFGSIFREIGSGKLENSGIMESVGVGGNYVRLTKKQSGRTIDYPIAHIE